MSKGRILCTEDDADSREMLVVVLSKAGYEVDHVEHPREAINFAKERSYDLILVDNWMPELTGEDLTKEIRTFDLVTPILFYSGAGYESDKQNALAAGAQGYLTKPTGILELVDEVEKLIAISKVPNNSLI
jgi:DNA-binding response OmpR family regulator